MESGDTAFYAARFLGVEVLVGFGKKLLDSLPFSTVNRNAYTRGEPGLFFILGHDDANAIGDLLRFLVLRLRQHESKFVAAVASGGIDRTAMNAQDSRETAERAAANQMPEAIVDFFQAIKIEQQDCEGAPGTVGALGFVFKHV